MEMIALVILILSAVVGFIAIFFTTFGTLIIMGGATFYSVLTGFEILTSRELVSLFTLYLCGEALEYVFIIAGAKKFGATNAAVAGAFIGGILGAIIGTAVFGFGIVAGTFLGIFAGAFLVEFTIHKDMIKSLKAGTGSVLGRFGSIVAKVVISMIMLAIIFTKVMSFVLS